MNKKDHQEVLWGMTNIFSGKVCGKGLKKGIR